jgi:quinol monooxygenase YgiN
VLLVCRFVVAPDAAPGFAERAHRALRLLSDADGCLGAELGRAVDDPARWVLIARFDSVSAYRRALSPFEARAHLVPLLSEALPDEPATFEMLAEAVGGALTAHGSLRDEAVGHGGGAC